MAVKLCVTSTRDTQFSYGWGHKSSFTKTKDQNLIDTGENDYLASN